jgi:hypothetical protein
MFHDFYTAYLDHQYPNKNPGEDSFYTHNRDSLTVTALSKASIKRDSWDPEQGFGANRPTIVNLYEYYKNSYIAAPDRFLWAGLGRMAGGAVLGGLDFLVNSEPDPDFLTCAMVLIGKQIFLDLAWQHEAFLVDSQQAITLGHEHDARFPAKESYETAWTKIASETPADIATGNKMLLANEQFTIIQPLYDAIKSNPDSGDTFSHTRAFTSNVHPYHRDFSTAFPSADVTVADDRWAWISEPDGMWEKWVVIPPDERTRLVSLAIDDIIKQRWAPTISEFLPPGSQ